MATDVGRVGDADQALVASDGAATHLHPPSRGGLQNFVHRERLSRSFYGALLSWWASSCSAGISVLGSLMFCITYPPAPMWRIVACSVWVVASVWWAVSSTAALFRADAALREFDDAELDYLERTGA